MKKNYPSSVAVEIKATKTNTIPPSALKNHQKKALLAVQSQAGLSYKIPDTARIRLPFDAFQLKNTDSFVIACFVQHGTCIAILPENWVGAKFEPLTENEFVIEL